DARERRPRGTTLEHPAEPDGRYRDRDERGDREHAVRGARGRARLTGRVHREPADDKPCDGEGADERENDSHASAVQGASEPEHEGRGRDPYRDGQEPVTPPVRRDPV